MAYKDILSEEDRKTLLSILSEEEYEALFGETHDEHEHNRLKQNSDDAAESACLRDDFVKDSDIQLCKSKYLRRTKDRLRPKEWWKKYWPVVLLSALWFYILAKGLSAVHNQHRIDKKVYEYGKTIPEYLKQNIGHSR